MTAAPSPSLWDRLSEGALRGRILLTAYAPLNLILALRVDPLAPRAVCGALVALGALDALRLMTLAGNKGAVPRSFTTVRDSGGQVAAYLATYLLPLLAAPEPDAWDLAAYAVYGAIIAIITLRSDLAHINPTLYLFGWRVVTVVTAGGDERFLICRHPPKPGVAVPVTRLAGVLHTRA